MKIAIADLVGTSPYSQSKHYEDPRLPKELPGAYDERTWRSRMHTDPKGHVQIPGTSFAVAVKTACKRLKLQVPGKGKSEWTKYFEAGVMCMSNITLPILAKDVPCERLFVPSNGQRGGGKRVIRNFPLIENWKGQVQFLIFDDLITRDIFKQVLNAAGVIVGIGRFRPESCGWYGRFSVKNLTWEEANVDDLAAE